MMELILCLHTGNGLSLTENLISWLFKLEIGSEYIHEKRYTICVHFSVELFLRNLQFK